MVRTPRNGVECRPSRREVSNTPRRDAEKRRSKHVAKTHTHSEDLFTFSRSKNKQQETNSIAQQTHEVQECRQRRFNRVQSATAAVLLIPTAARSTRYSSPVGALRDVEIATKTNHKALVSSTVHEPHERPTVRGNSGPAACARCAVRLPFALQLGQPCCGLPSPTTTQSPLLLSEMSKSVVSSNFPPPRSVSVPGGCQQPREHQQKPPRLLVHTGGARTQPRVRRDQRDKRLARCLGAVACLWTVLAPRLYTEWRKKVTTIPGGTATT